MGLPTFDFGNILRSIIGKSVNTIYSPLTLFLALSTGLGALAGTIYSLVSSFITFLPSVPFVDLNSVFFFSGDTTFSQFISYLICAEDLFLFLNILIRFVNFFIGAIPVFLFTFTVLALVYRFSLVVRSAILSTVLGVK